MAIRTLWVVFLGGAMLLGCPAKTTPPDEPGANTDAGTNPQPTDADGDGHPEDTDCDDNDPLTYPGALEAACDPKDRNCDDALTPSGVDTDGDGEDDCLDVQCEVPPELTDPVLSDPACKGALSPVADPWNVTLEWLVDAAQDATGITALPLVGFLSDTNADGEVNTEDRPDVVVVTKEGSLLILDGRTGVARWTRPNLLAPQYTMLALGDVNADGRTDIVVLDGSGLLEARNADGTLLWDETLPMGSSTNTYRFLTLSDLEGDGRAEIITLDGVFDGLTGGLIFALTHPANAGTPFTAPVVVDLDLDGRKEIVIGKEVYASDGSAAFSFQGATTSLRRWNVPLNADADSAGELLSVSAQQIALYDPDGTQLDSFAITANAMGPPCVADFDGDGVDEVGIVGSVDVSIYELSGGSLWSKPIQALSLSGAGCTASDLNGDGKYELLFSDEVALYFLDGATGDLLYRDPDHRSLTRFDYPVVADVDGDGAAEVLVAGSAQTSVPILQLYSHQGAGWARVGSHWHDRHFPSSTTATGAIIPNPLPPWESTPPYGGRAPLEPDGANLTASLGASCASSAVVGVGTVKVEVHLGNEGLAAIAGDVAVVARTTQGEELQRVNATGGLAGGASKTVELEFSLEVARAGVRIALDPDDAAAECDETDNVLEFQVE